MLKDNTVLITDKKVLAIPIEECGEDVVDLKDAGGIEFGPVPECPATEPDYTIMRKTVYEKLLAAQKNFQEEIKFRLYEAYRNLAVQQMLFDKRYALVEKTFPDLSGEEKFIETTRLVAPVINFDGTRNIPPHSTGGAFDIELRDKNGEIINMGMRAKNWATVDPDLCSSSCKNISTEAKKNRRLLSEALTKASFVNYFTE